MSDSENSRPHEDGESESSNTSDRSNDDIDPSAAPDSVMASLAPQSTRPGNGPPASPNVSAADMTPEQCIATLSNPKFQTLMEDIKKRICGAEPEWIEKFLNLRGLEKLFETLEALTSKDKAYDVTPYSPLPSLYCIESIKGIMKNQLASDNLLAASELISKLTKCLVTTNIDIRAKIVELLSAIAKMSKEGYETVVKAMQRCRTTFVSEWTEFLVQQMRSETDANYRTNLLVFFSCLIMEAPNLEQRRFMTKEFRPSGFADVASSLMDGEGLQSRFRLLLKLTAESIPEDDDPDNVDATRNECFGLVETILGNVSGTPITRELPTMLKHLAVLYQKEKYSNSEISPAIERFRDVVSAAVVQISEGGVDDASVMMRLTAAIDVLRGSKTFADAPCQTSQVPDDKNVDLLGCLIAVSVQLAKFGAMELKDIYFLVKNGDLDQLPADKREAMKSYDHGLSVLKDEADFLKLCCEDSIFPLCLELLDHGHSLGNRARTVKGSIELLTEASDEILSNKSLLKFFRFVVDMENRMHQNSANKTICVSALRGILDRNLKSDVTLLDVIVEYGLSSKEGLLDFVTELPILPDGSNCSLNSLLAEYLSLKAATDEIKGKMAQANSDWLNKTSEKVLQSVDTCVAQLLTDLGLLAMLEQRMQRQFSEGQLALDQMFKFIGDLVQNVKRVHANIENRRQRRAAKRTLEEPVGGNIIKQPRV